jgi:hypothetical protein
MTGTFLRSGILIFALVAVMPADTPPRVDSPAFHEFSSRVQQYLRLQQAAPRIRTTSKRQEIVERRQALARHIRETRAGAKPGDLFSPEISAEFQQVIRETLQGSNRLKVRKTIREGAPVKGWHLLVNSDYPEDLPTTTVPPALLLRLPQLPPQVAYRIIGRDFVLEDTEARVVIDFISGVLP